jgi:hypothetical protein
LDVMRKARIITRGSVILVVTRVIAVIT